AAEHGLSNGLATEQDIACDSGQWLGTPGSDIALHICSLRSSSWPRVILVGAKGSTLAAAEGLPPMLPVLEAALQIALGRPPPAGELDAAVALVRAKYPASLASGSHDFADYKRLVESARLYAGTDNYAGAEDAYRKALEIEIRAFGATSLAVGG